MPLSDAYVDFIAGWASGAASVIALQPVDTVLTRRQAGLINASSRLNWTLSARALAENFGGKALWRGASPMVSAVPFQNAILMGGYGMGQQYAEQGASQEKCMAIFVGGCTGGVLQSFLMSPVELIKVSQQCNLEANALSNGKTVAQRIVSSSSWRGLRATLLRDGIPHGVWFATYEACKDILSPLVGKDNVVVPLGSGAIAATVAWAVGYPFDLIKTRQQAGNNQKVMETAFTLIEEADGRVFRGLYSGFRLKLIRAVPASMIGFSVYEWVKSQLVQT